MSATIENTAAMVPAAGNSGRMGIPKALIRLPDGRTFLEQIVTVYFELGIRNITVVVNPTIFKVIEYRKPIYYDDVNWVINPTPEKGRMLSIAMGLKKLIKYSYCFIQNIDQPFAKVELLQDMMRYSNHGMCIAPFYQGRGGASPADQPGSDGIPHQGISVSRQPSFRIGRF